MNTLYLLLNYPAMSASFSISMYLFCYFLLDLNKGLVHQIYKYMRCTTFGPQRPATSCQGYRLFPGGQRCCNALKTAVKMPNKTQNKRKISQKRQCQILVAGGIDFFSRFDVHSPTVLKLFSLRHIFCLSLGKESI